MDLASKLFKGDRVIWVIFMFLCLISLVVVFSATSTLAYKNANYWAPVGRHASFLLAGLFAVLVIHNIPYKYMSALILLIPVSIVLLIITPFIGESTNEASRWLSLFGIQFQPSEFAKLASVVFIAFMLSRRPAMSDQKAFKYILIGVGTMCVLILPENFSTAIFLFGICFLMLFIGQIPMRMLFKLAAVLMLAGTLFIGAIYAAPQGLVQYLPDRAVTWKNRLDNFASSKQENNANGEFKITDENRQFAHAKMAIATGGMFGKLPGQGQQRDFLPQAYSDFIYAIIVEETGLVGGMVVLFLYIFLLIRVAIIAKKCEKSFPRYLVLGCGLLIVVQALFNIAIAVDFFPVSGQPLPLISRGGTSTILTCAYFGIILSVSRFGAGMGEKEEEEITEEESDAVVEEPAAQTLEITAEVE